ncbi:protein LURP-one-related 15-like [Salvia divinorum]|uniref:Protein LURP-one-related 15-like n=1 Tax=Salvia divinorum TaxID=28513 RepID=A0ABD1GN86_SALDI
MSAGPSYPPAAAVAVLSPQYCVGHPVEFTITRKMMTMHAGTFGVTDADGNIVFKVQGKSMSLHDRRVLLDAAGNPLITFQQKLMTAHRR